jgi:hypothetical protein
VADAIDASVFQKQRTEGEPVPDLGRGHARAQQLGAGHNPVGPARHPSNFAIRAAFVSHYNT